MTILCSLPVPAEASSRTCGTCDRDGLCREPYSPAITLVGRAADNGLARTWLDRLKALPTGNRLLARLDRAAAASGPLELRWSAAEAWTIRLVSPSIDPQSALAADIDRSDPQRPVVVPGARGRLADLVVHVHRILELEGRRVVRMNILNPAPVLLGHELIHALHWAEGVAAHAWPDFGNAMDGSVRAGARVPAPVEEIRTVGLREWAWEEMNENRLRRELGAPQRVDYSSLPVRAE